MLLEQPWWPDPTLTGHLPHIIHCMNTDTILVFRTMSVWGGVGGIHCNHEY